MTTWTSPCDTGDACIQTRTVGDRVEIRDTEYPEVVLSVPAEAWEAFLASVTGLPPGGETRQEWGAVKHSHRPWDFVYRATAEAARHTAAIWAGDAFPAGRTVTEWPAGTRLVGPWRPVDTEETKP